MRFRASVATVLVFVMMAAIPAMAGIGENTSKIKWNQGKAAYDSGNYAGAIAIWEDPSVARYAQDEVAYFMWLAGAYANSGAFDKAVSTGRRGLAMNPTDGPTVSGLHWTLAKAYLGLKQYDPAVVEAEASIAAAPQDPWTYLLLARIQYDAGRYDKTVTAAARSLELKASADGCALLGLAHMRQGLTAAALQNCQQGLALDPKNSNARQGVMLAQMALMDFPAAAVSAKEAAEAGLEEGPSYECAALYYMGRYAEAMTRIDARLAERERGGLGVKLALTPQNGVILQEVLSGSPAEEAGLKAGDWLYEVDGQKVIKGAFNIQLLMPLDQIVERLRGAPGTSVTLKVWRPGKLTPFERAVTRRPLVQSDSAVDYGLRSLIWRAKGDPDKALADAQKAASLDKTPFLTAFSLGFALLDRGQPEEALRAFDDPAMTPTLLPFAEAHRQVGRALCFAKRGELDRAAEVFFAAADRLDARCVPAWLDRTSFLALLQPLAQGHLDQAKKLEAQGQYAACLPEYAQALRYASDDRSASDLRAALFAAAGKMPTPPELPEEARRRVVRGELLVKEGDLERALPEFAEALRIAPYLPKLYFNAALLNGQLKRYAEATRLMNIYLQAAPEAPDARAAKDEIIKWELLSERQGRP